MAANWTSRVFIYPLLNASMTECVSTAGSLCIIKDLLADRAEKMFGDSVKVDELSIDFMSIQSAQNLLRRVFV
jgi:hypothetical protein